MSQEMIKFDENNTISLENSSHIKEEFQDEYYPDNKVCLSQNTITDTINISNSELNGHLRNDQIMKYETLSVHLIKTGLPSSELNNTVSNNVKIEDVYYPDNKVWLSETAITDTISISNSELNGHLSIDQIMKYETLSVDHIKADLPSSEINDIVSINVKIEDTIYPDDTQIKFCNELRFCNHCHEVYQDYCTKCRVLVHILNKSPHNTYNRIKQLPDYMLETIESYGHLGIFSLKVIPENVRFGPFAGLNCTGLPLRIKGGRFVVGDDKLELLNWMQYINPARNIYEQNLFPFQYEDKLYYCSTRRIQEGEELLVYFGEKYVESLVENVEMDFVPIANKDVENVYACTFCCLGFSSKEYLAEHKAVFHSETNGMFSVKELVQCSFCKVYLEVKEYFKHHMDYCREANARHCVLLSQKDYKREVKSCSSLRSKAKRCKREIYKCTQCKFGTIYKAEFRHHTNEHYEVKMYKYGIYHRRYSVKDSFNARVEKKQAMFDYSKAKINRVKERSSHLHDGEKQFQSSKPKLQTRRKCHINGKHLKLKELKCAACEYQTNWKSNLETHMKARHIKLRQYKCTECDYQTTLKAHLEKHIKAIHLKQEDYKCMQCEYQTNFKERLERHIKTKHLKLNDYKCMECDYQTNIKLNLVQHIKSKHLKLKDYKCMECDYKAFLKSSLERHVKAKHLKLRDYKCVECEYTANRKASLERHIKAIHLKQKDYECMECEYKANRKSNLELHIKTKHLKLSDYKCMECEYQTNVKSNLEQHVKAKHLKLKEYRCVECEYQTSFKVWLERHIKTKHLKLCDYKCMECEYQTNLRLNLERHIKSRHLKLRDYKCTECDFQTNYKSSLEQHIKSKHLKLNDYKCMECEYQTNYKSSLQTHIKAKHVKLRGYKCMECGYETICMSTLGRHMQRKHLKAVDSLT